MKNLSVPTGDDFDCTLPLNFTLNELQIVRVEKRVQHASHPTSRLVESETGKTSPGPHMRVVRELLLGDVHTDLAERQRHRPTSFQEPLKEVEVSRVLSRTYDVNTSSVFLLSLQTGTISRFPILN